MYKNTIIHVCKFKDRVWQFSYGLSPKKHDIAYLITMSVWMVDILPLCLLFTKDGRARNIYYEISEDFLTYFWQMIAKWRQSDLYMLHIDLHFYMIFRLYFSSELRIIFWKDGLLKKRNLISFMYLRLQLLPADKKIQSVKYKANFVVKNKCA